MINDKIDNKDTYKDLIIYLISTTLIVASNNCVSKHVCLSSAHFDIVQF